MSGLILVGLGPPPKREGSVLAELAGFLRESVGLDARPSKIRLDIETAYDEARGQYRASALLPLLDEIGASTESAVLGVTEVDLMSPLFTFVFGEAVLGGRSAVVSLHRLRSERYGLPPDPGLAEARLRRVVLHELGHLAGLVHCRGATCVMRFSGAAEEVDLTDEDYCVSCSREFKDWDAVQSPTRTPTDHPLASS